MAKGPWSLDVTAAIHQSKLPCVFHVEKFRSQKGFCFYSQRMTSEVVLIPRAPSAVDNVPMETFQKDSR